MWFLILVNRFAATKSDNLEGCLVEYILCGLVGTDDLPIHIQYPYCILYSIKGALPFLDRSHDPVGLDSQFLLLRCELHGGCLHMAQLPEKDEREHHNEQGKE